MYHHSSYIGDQSTSVQKSVELSGTIGVTSERECIPISSLVTGQFFFFFGKFHKDPLSLNYSPWVMFSESSRHPDFFSFTLGRSLCYTSPNGSRVLRRGCEPDFGSRTWLINSTTSVTLATTVTTLTWCRFVLSRFIYVNTIRVTSTTTTKTIIFS